MDISLFRMRLSRLGRRLRQEARNTPDTWTRMLVLSAVDRLGAEATPSAIGAAESLRSSNLAALLRDLEADGLVTRTRDTIDRRKIRVQLSAAGRESLQLSRQRRDEWLERAIGACLNEDERQRLVAIGPILEKLSAYSEPPEQDQ
ncbi:MarR family transcriptional regulator [Burkholderia sp. PU8-34]